MISIKKYILVAGVALLGLSSCEKNEIGFTKDQKPDIPVTITNAADFRPEPTVTTSIAGGGAIQIVLSIPTSSGRRIKEITRIAASTNYQLVQNILPINTVGGFLNAFPTTPGIFSYATSPAVASNLILAGGYYNLTPIPVNATTYTYNTSLTQYFSIFPAASNNLAAAANRELSFRLYFLVTLDDGTVLIADPVRILVLA